jgi:hypothetical protein
MPRSRAFAFVTKEIEEVLPPVVFFAVELDARLGRGERAKIFFARHTPKVRSP